MVRSKCIRGGDIKRGDDLIKIRLSFIRLLVNPNYFKLSGI